MKAIIKFYEILDSATLLEQLRFSGGPRGLHNLGADTETDDNGEKWEFTRWLVKAKNATLEHVRDLLNEERYLFRVEEVLVTGQGYSE